MTTCKDCIHFKDRIVNAEGFITCPKSGMKINTEDFCSYGAKMDKE